jgi:hypothetical protein
MKTLNDERTDLVKKANFKQIYEYRRNFHNPHYASSNLLDTVKDFTIHPVDRSGSCDTKKTTEDYFNKG